MHILVPPNSIKHTLWHSLNDSSHHRSEMNAPSEDLVFRPAVHVLLTFTADSVAMILPDTAVPVAVILPYTAVPVAVILPVTAVPVVVILPDSCL